MTSAEIAIGVAIGLVSGVLAGLFGVGGGIVMTPGIQVAARGSGRSWRWPRLSR